MAGHVIFLVSNAADLNSLTYETSEKFIHLSRPRSVLNVGLDLFIETPADSMKSKIFPFSEKMEHPFPYMRRVSWTMKTHYSVATVDSYGL